MTKVIHGITLPELAGTVGLVPTMGALHSGHARLISQARSECDTLVVSDFVNPLQFGEPDDYDNYPRMLDADVALCESLGVDYLLAPSVEDMYPSGPEICVRTGRMGEVLEGASRPGHFDGVATVVAKLFNIVSPDRAYFGRKDAQQVAILRRMIKDLNFDVEIIPVGVVRGADSLAESSRNLRLSEQERQQALVLPRALHALADGSSIAEARHMIDSSDGVELDYLVTVDPDDFTPIESRPALALAAMRVGIVRLIDNVDLP